MVFLLLLGLHEARSSAVREVSEEAEESDDVVEAKSSSIANLDIFTSLASVLLEIALAINEKIDYFIQVFTVEKLGLLLTFKPGLHIIINNLK